MSRYRRQPNPFVNVLPLALLVAIWFLFAPIEFGGLASYVIVHGNSMEPGYYSGDLVILHAADDYHIGDIATYRHPDIGPVIHRIIGREDSHFVFKGDHNTWIDAYRPLRGELIGKAWVYVPAAGKLIEEVRTPHTMALLAGAIGVFFMATVTSDEQQRRKHRTRRLSMPITVRFVLGESVAPRMGATNAPKQPHNSSVAAIRDMLLLVLGTLGFAALLLAALAFTRPVERVVEKEVSYQQSGSFTYSAAVPPGVYDTDKARSGDALFLRLSNQMDLSFSYRIFADQPAKFNGSYRLNAEISDGAGWRRTLQLQPDTTFDNGAFSINTTLDFSEVQTLIDAFEKQTALTGQQYTLAVVPQVTLKGTLAGQELQDNFAPRLEFRFDKVRMQLVSLDGSANPLQPAKAGAIKVSDNEPNTLALPGIILEVATARRLALIGLFLALSGGLALSVVLKRLAGADEIGRIQMEYGPLLLDVRAGALEACEHIIAVAAISDLAKLAEREGHMLLHQVDGDTHRYFVQDNGVTYLYVPPVSSDATNVPQVVAPPETR